MILQTSDYVETFHLIGSNFKFPNILISYFVLWQCCLNGLVRFRHKKMVRVRKGLCFALSYLVLSPKTWLQNVPTVSKMSWFVGWFKWS